MDASEEVLGRGPRSQLLRERLGKGMCPAWGSVAGADLRRSLLYRNRAMCASFWASEPEVSRASACAFTEFLGGGAASRMAAPPSGGHSVFCLLNYPPQMRKARAVAGS